MNLDKLKKRFDHREITPSKGLWDQLDSRLDAHKHRSQPLLQRFWWVGIAALLLLGLLIFPLSRKRNPQQNPPEIMVTAPVNKPNQELSTEPVSQDPASGTTPVIQQTTTGIASAPLYQAQNAGVHSQQQSVAQKTYPSPKPETGQNSYPMISKKEMATLVAPIPLIDSQPDSGMVGLMESVAPSIPSRHGLEGLTAQQQTDLLLEQAMEALVTKPLPETAALNPQKLLLETEWDLESDRRERLNNKINKGLEQVAKNALALIRINRE